MGTTGMYLGKLDPTLKHHNLVIFSSILTHVMHHALPSSHPRLLLCANNHSLKNVFKCKAFLLNKFFWQKSEITQHLTSGFIVSMTAIIQRVSSWQHLRSRYGCQATRHRIQMKYLPLWDAYWLSVHVSLNLTSLLDKEKTTTTTTATTMMTLTTTMSETSTRRGISQRFPGPGS